jgi:hypothetical protein
MGNDEVPQEPNALEWSGAYLVDTVITIVATPFVVLAVAAIIRYGGADDAITYSDPEPGNTTAVYGGTPVYNASQCIGPIVMDECKGSTIGPPAKVCYGKIINGQCTGPAF